MRKKKQRQSTDKKKSVINAYKTLCFRLIGSFFEKRKDRYKRLGEKLRMANWKFTPDVYLSVVIITTLLTAILSCSIFFIIFYLILQSPSWILYTLGLTGVAVIAITVFFPFTMQSKISNRKTHLEQEIPFVLSELSILASTGLTPIKIMRHMAQRKEIGVAHSEFKKIIFMVDVEGKDLITALSEAAKETPSPLFRESLWDLANMIHQGGDLDEYLRMKADTTMQVKRDIQKEFIERLGTYAEMYITLVLVGVLFIGIAAFLMNAMGSSFAGFTADTLLLLLSYGFIPVAIIVVNVIVSMAYAKSG